MKPIDLFKIVISTCLPVFLGTPLMFMDVESLQQLWHNLNLPAFAPPRWVFPIAWVYMYAGLGMGMWFIWDMPRTKDRNIALLVYIVKVILNFIFNILFFYWRNFQLAFFVLVLTWFTTAKVLTLFYKQRRIAAYLSLPYFFWRTYSLTLAYSAWQLNS